MIAETITVLRDVPIRNYVAVHLSTTYGFFAYYQAPQYDTRTKSFKPDDYAYTLAQAAKFTTVGDAVRAMVDRGNPPPDADGFTDGWCILGVIGQEQRRAEERAQHDCHRREREGCVAMPAHHDRAASPDFDRWLEFTFRCSADRLVIQAHPEQTVRLTREQADRLVSHLAEVAYMLPPLWERLGRPAPFTLPERD